MDDVELADFGLQRHTAERQTKAGQGRVIYIAPFIQKGNPMCFTKERIKAKEKKE